MVDKGYPNLKTALNLWEKGIEERCCKSYGFEKENEYRFHTKGVALAASKIAELIPELNPEKAYILGLLHDYGKKICEGIEHNFHGRVGYEEMLKMGYNDVARICLTHTFPEKDFNNINFSYPSNWLEWVRGRLKNIQYDDYDYLICLTDRFFEGLSMVSIEKRAFGIAQRYKINQQQIRYFTEQSFRLKTYFDKKTGKDVYITLGIK